jgi:hypothetical protein
MPKYNAHPGAAEHNVIEAIDGKAQLERSAAPDEILALLVATGTIPPDDAVMPMDKARRMSAVSLPSEFQAMPLASHLVIPMMISYKPAPCTGRP